MNLTDANLNAQTNVQECLADLTASNYALCLVTSRRVPTGDATFPNYLVAGALRRSTRTDWSNVYGPVWELWNTSIFKCAPWPNALDGQRHRIAHWYEEAKFGMEGAAAHHWFHTATLSVAPDGVLVWVESADLSEALALRTWSRPSASREQLSEIVRGRTVIEWAVTCNVQRVVTDADYTIVWSRNGQ